MSQMATDMHVTSFGAGLRVAVSPERTLVASISRVSLLLHSTTTSSTARWHDATTAMKPFRVPSLVRKSTTEDGLLHDGEPAAKKRRVSADSADDDVASVAAAANILKRAQAKSTFKAPMISKPLDVVRNPTDPFKASGSSEGVGEESYYNVLW